MVRSIEVLCIIWTDHLPFIIGGFQQTTRPMGPRFRLCAARHERLPETGYRSQGQCFHLDIVIAVDALQQTRHRDAKDYSTDAMVYLWDNYIQYVDMIPVARLRCSQGHVADSRMHGRSSSLGMVRGAMQ